MLLQGEGTQDEQPKGKSPKAEPNLSFWWCGKGLYVGQTEGRTCALEISVYMLKSWSGRRDMSYELFYYHSWLQPLLQKHGNSRTRGITVKATFLVKVALKSVFLEELQSVCSFSISVWILSKLSKIQIMCVCVPALVSSLKFIVLSGSMYDPFQPKNEKTEAP